MLNGKLLYLNKEFNLNYFTIFKITINLIIKSKCCYNSQWYLTLSQTTNFRLFQTEEFTDDSFEFDQHGKKFSKRVENTVGKRRNCSLRAISPFPIVFS